MILTPRTNRQLLKEIKELKTSPKAIVFGGMHEESEASWSTILRNVEGKPLHEHFGNDVVFVRIPPRNTAASLLKRTRRLWEGQLKKIADGLVRLEGFTPHENEKYASFMLKNPELDISMPVAESNLIPANYADGKDGKLKNLGQFYKLFAQRIRRIMPESEWGLAESVHAMHPQSLIIRVHGFDELDKRIDRLYPRKSEVEAPQGMMDRVAEANRKIGDCFTLNPGGDSKGILVELRVKQHLIPNNRQEIKKYWFSHEVLGGQVTRSYLSRTIHPGGRSTKQVLDENAIQLKGFLYHLLQGAASS